MFNDRTVVLNKESRVSILIIKDTTSNRIPIINSEFIIHLRKILSVQFAMGFK
jgi:hypothetical protein